MTTIRRARTSDLYNLDLCNLDPLTENYDRGFYLEYLFHWPSLFNVVENEQGQIVGYSTSPLLSINQSTYQIHRCKTNQPSKQQ